MGSDDAKRKQNISQGPRGTRDFYPEEMRRRRWIEDSWRQVAVRHGFAEVDGPRFEHLDLYTVKSGEGIVSELFTFTRAGGDTQFALRPEFTPTAARMVAARANSLPRPTKWFSVGPYFRAERPQRGRLREFLQWNVDVFGDDSPRADAEVIACCVDLLRDCGFDPSTARIRLSHREYVSGFLKDAGVNDEQMDGALALLDKGSKIPRDALLEEASKQALPGDVLASILDSPDELRETIGRAGVESGLADALSACSVMDWIDIDTSIVRGLAYYTGTVFEVHEAGGEERAIAGGGRYDKLIELFGGPPTPAVGFAMGDVVLSLVLEDRELMPTDTELREYTGQQVHVFVIAENEEADAQMFEQVSDLRSVGLHARHSYKSTRNVGKLVKEAKSIGARCALFVNGSEQARLEQFETGDSAELPLEDVANAVLAIAMEAPAP